MHRSEITIDLGALRRNVRTLLRTLDGARLWAVVKADGYGHGANSAAALRLPESHFDAVRCGGAIYGLSPFNTDPQEDGLEPVLSWQATLVQVKRLEPGQSTGYGRRFVAKAATWIGIAPVGYGDGFRRDLTGTEVRVAGEPRRVVGTV